MYNDDIDSQYVGNLLTQFAQAINRGQTIDYIIFIYNNANQINNDYIQLFANTSSLQCLVLEEINLQGSGVYLEKFLSENNSIRKLELRKTIYV